MMMVIFTMVSAVCSILPLPRNSKCVVKKFLLLGLFEILVPCKSKLSNVNYLFRTGPMPAGNYMFKINSRNTRTRCEICSKLTIKILKRRQWRRSGIVIVNFKHISHLVSVLLLLTLSR